MEILIVDDENDLQRLDFFIKTQNIPKRSN